jgi:hypothetical protein
MTRFYLNQRLGYPKIKLRWLKELAYRRFLDWYRRSDFCLSTGSGILTPLEATFRQLELLGLYPRPLIVLEVFGGFGLCKATDLIARCEHITHIEIHDALLHHAKKILPAERTVFLNADSIQVVRRGILPRNDYNFIHVDNDCGKFGDYYENFDLFPWIVDCLGDWGSLVFNVQLDIRHMDPDPVWLNRRQKFFGLDAAEDAACVGYETAKRAYLAHIPRDRFAVREVFPVPHFGQTIYLVICLSRISPKFAIQSPPTSAV